MSVFGPNQVEELIIGNAVAAETTAATFIASASDKEIKVLSSNGTAPAVGVDFKLLQKTGSTITGLNYEFSDTVPADGVDQVILKEYSAETLKSVRIEGFDGNLVANTTYAVEIRHFSDNSSLSPENFSVVTGYWVSGAAAPASAAIVRNGIVASLNHNLDRQGGGEFVITTPDTSETDILITGAAQVALPGKVTGRQIEFEVTAKQFDDTAVSHENLGLLTTTLVASNNPGTGTGKYAVNLEWFTKGYKYEVYRQSGFPADFTERTPFYATQTLNYNAIHIKYKKSRISPTVEEQPRVLTILVERANLAGNANTNDVLTDLRTALGTANVPVDLAVA
jgi:hypothetical protein|tara:strand:- start:7734 stop:8747 length:1014 start_codon:yes stop_codon:yes gene_type:complete